MSVKEIKVSNFLNEDYHRYALHTVENRAIGSCIDGMKPIHRKIFFTSLNNVKNVSNKVSTLAGKVISEAMYHNGNISCEEAIVLMTQDFKNNIPYFRGIGQFGSLKNPFSSSSRYISVVLTTSILDVFKDEFLLEQNVEDSIKVEPKYYLPIIPMIIINGTSGIALGYSTKILNREPLDIIDCCIKLLNEKPIKSDLIPKINGFHGKVIVDPENPKKWNFIGTYELGKLNQIRITEIPPSMTYEKYESHLDDLVEKKIIQSYENLSNDRINYVVKFNGKTSSLDEEDILKIFKLVESHTEILTTLDEHGKLKLFEAVQEIIEYFVQFRLTFYEKRKSFLLNKLNQELKFLSNRGKFITYILNGKILINNKPKIEIQDQINSAGLEEIDGNFDYLLRLPIHSLTKENFEKIKEEYKTKKEEIEILLKILPKEMYLGDLQELKKKISKS